MSLRKYPMYLKYEMSFSHRKKQKKKKNKTTINSLIKQIFVKNNIRWKKKRKI